VSGVFSLEPKDELKIILKILREARRDKHRYRRLTSCGNDNA
jgi:hypothetical protein